MRKLYEMPNTVVNLRTPEEAEEYFAMCREVGWVWCSGGMPKLHYDNTWSQYKKETCIRIEKKLSYQSKCWYKFNDYKVITFNELKEILMDNEWKVGDVLVSEDLGEKKILGICGDVFFMSGRNNFKNYYSGYTKTELEGNGYKLKTEPKQKLTITMDEIAKKFGYKPSEFCIEKGE